MFGSGSIRPCEVTIAKHQGLYGQDSNDAADGGALCCSGACCSMLYVYVIYTYFLCYLLICIYISYLFLFSKRLKMLKAEKSFMYSYHVHPCPKWCCIVMFSQVESLKLPPVVVIAKVAVIAVAFPAALPMAGIPMECQMLKSLVGRDLQ